MKDTVILNIIKKINYSGSLWHYGHFIHDFIVPVISFMRNNKCKHIHLVINKPWCSLGTFLKMAEKILGVQITEINPNTVSSLDFPIHNVNTLGFGPYKPMFFMPINNHIKTTLNITESSYKVILIERGISKLKNNDTQTGYNRRHLKNHIQLKNILSNYYGGLFKNVILEKISIDEQVSLFNNAKIVIGQHGSGLCNIVWMNQPDSLVIEFPPYAVNTFLHMCKAKKFKYVRIEPNPQKVIEVCSRRMPNLIELPIKPRVNLPIEPSNPIYKLTQDMGVINVLKFGLGNRMFMIATGFALAKYNNIKFYINKHVENKHSNNNYNETIFKYSGDFVDINTEDIIEYGYKLIKNAKYPFKEPYRIDNNSGVVLHGCFQNYTFFKDIENEISTLFLKGLESHILLMSKKYNTENTAFLHIRRGDYLQPLIKKMFAQPNIGYYIKNVKSLTELNKNITKIFIFTNDIEFVKSKGYFYNPLFQIIDESDELNLLALMTLCKAGAIITNSTFGWWGAFLGAHLVKNPVFVFKKWRINMATPGLIPSTWIKV